MSVRPSTVATVAAAKRAKARNRPGKSAPLNLMDTLKAMDKQALRVDKLEKTVSDLKTVVEWLSRNK